jgi:NAD+ kinase
MSESHRQSTSRNSSLSRRSSRPTSLRIIQHEDCPSHNLKYSDNIRNDSNLSSAPSPQTSPRPVRDDRRPMDSPCFVHSHLDKGASLSEWLHDKQPLLSRETNVGVSKSLQRTNGIFTPEGSITPPNSSSDVDEDGFAESLTKQLAETAVGVREMSKQLGQCSSAFAHSVDSASHPHIGRARIHSNIQNVLIVTKARDNRLINLTRELALYLMLKPQKGHTRGLVVCVAL